MRSGKRHEVLLASRFPVYNGSNPMKYYLLYKLISFDIEVIVLTQSTETLMLYVPSGTYLDDFIKDEDCYGIQIDKNVYLEKVIAQ